MVGRCPVRYWVDRSAGDGTLRRLMEWHLLFCLSVHYAGRRLFRNTALAFFLISKVCVAQANTNTYEIASPAVDLVGELRIVSARASETLMDIARAHDVGHREIRLANPELDIWLPGEGSQVVIPSYFLLPNVPREGIVLNRSEMRLYYFHQDQRTGKSLVSTYPVGIGRADRQTPTASGRVTNKLHEPAWYPTKEIRADYAARGTTLDTKVPPGPDNPLGQYAITLDLPGYVIHGTNRPDGIGMLVSQGCVRLYPEDIEALVKQVALETRVSIVDQPQKVGLVDGKLVIEVHPPVYPENDRTQSDLFWRIAHLLQSRDQELGREINWDRVADVVQRADGIPAVVSGTGVNDALTDEAGLPVLDQRAISLRRIPED